MIKLKVKCSICGKEESNEELVKKVAEIIKEHGLKAEHYLNFLNLMSEKCLNSDEHSFLFDEEFTASVNEIVTKYKNDILEVEKLDSLNKEINKEISETEIKLNELKSKIMANNSRTVNLQRSIINYINEIELSTGYENVVTWY